MLGEVDGEEGTGGVSAGGARGTVV
jgi:hypothetical protein